MIDQTMVNDFAPFKGVMTKIKGKYDPAYEVYLGLYQQLKGSDGRPDLYKTFPSDFFDLIVVDECHRGSAAEDSSWREVLSYFGSATQVGLTATPKNEKTIQNYEYFGEPVYTYSLKQGIEDGFLAPYRVLRVGLDKDIEDIIVKKGTLNTDGDEVDDGYLAVHQVFQHIAVDGDADGGDGQTEEEHARHLYQTGLAEIVCDKRRADKEKGIERQAHQQVEPEHGVIVARRGRFQVDEPLGESASLNGSRDGGEEGEHTHDAIFGRREQPAEHNAEDDIQHLHATIVDDTP